MTLTALLERAGVSRTAYYSLARRASVLPGSIHALALALDVPPSDLLEELPRRVLEARRICEVEPRATFENVWHTLVLLDLDPVERLNRSLTRGRTAAVHR
jgi:hypothetical protein